MKNLNTEVLVIGGGATGTGVVRDLSMRGFKTILVEKRDYTHGTTGRYHGLLHSGGRYAVKDPQAARECIEENRILCRIMPTCIEDTGGFFVLTHWDDPEYIPLFIRGCQQAGIPLEEISLSQMLKEEPLLNPRISRCFRLPDASADSFLAAHGNVASAQQHGATILNYHQVLDLDLDKNRVVGVRCHDLIKDEALHITADLVVNAAGAWAVKIAAMAGAPLTILPGKGTMLALNRRVVNAVINRCKMPSDGDILVPAHTVAIIGTTDVKVEDPDHFGIEPWEVNLLMEEGEKLVPGFKNMRILRTWAGVRPLYHETSGSADRAVTRAFVLLDHEGRDGVSGLISITSGKWTTHRKMAEATVDLVCSKLGVQRACRTHLEELPHQGKSTFHTLGARLAHIEKENKYGSLVCECELVTVDDVTDAIIHAEAKSLDDIRRDTRLGMGPCQAGFCSLRASGILHSLRKIPIAEADSALHAFMQERWKGVLPILWGQQLRQERLDELIYRSLLNTDHLPGQAEVGITTEPYQPPGGYKTWVANSQENIPAGIPMMEPPEANQPACDVLVIGAGMAGLVCAWQAAVHGKKVKLISKGWGALHWHAGCVDVLGYEPGSYDAPVEDLLKTLKSYILKNPKHPYAIAGLDNLEKAIFQFKNLCDKSGYPLHGSLERNWLLPTSLGSLRPTCLAPETMIAGDIRQPGEMLIVGFQGYLDFYPEFIAANLQAQGIPAHGISLKWPGTDPKGFLTARVMADLFDTPGFSDEFLQALKSQIHISEGYQVTRIGFPAVLGLKDPLKTKQALEARLGLPIFEIPTLPPSIPGIRLHHLFVNAIKQDGGHVYSGMQVISAGSQNRQISHVNSEAAARVKSHPAGSFVLSTGGFLGGGFSLGYGQMPIENIFSLPLSTPPPASDWFDSTFLSPAGHPLFTSGVAVNQRFQPVDPAGHLLFSNLFMVGVGLSACDVLLERSLEGVALATGYVVGNQ